MSSSFSSWVGQHWADVAPDAAPPPAAAPVPLQRYPISYDNFDLRPEGNEVVAEMTIDVASGEPFVPHGYVYEVGKTQPLEDVRLTAAPGRPGRLQARFTQVEEGKPYSVSIGIFSRTDSLLKWFGDLSTFSLQAGAITTPKIDTLASELGCGA